MADRRLLYAAAFLRALATGMVAVLIGIYLAKRGFGAAAIGIVVTAGLAGAATAALVVTLAGDRLGRRRTLVALALLGAVGGTAVVLTSALPAVAVAAFVGMVNGMGRDRGASLIVDQAILPATASDTRRTTVFAWYNVLQDAGHALGALCAAAPALVRGFADTDEVASLRLALAACAGLHLATALAYTQLTTADEVDRSAVRRPMSPPARRVLWRISWLFGLDSVAGGFLTAALLSLFFFHRFDVAEGTLGALFFGARLANAVSHLGAAWLARRIGLVNTMVFTHVPSSLLLATVAYAPTFPVAAALFLVREGLVEMDVPTRQSYVMAMVRPEERTVAAGVTHLVRLAGWAAGPVVAGLLMSGTSPAAPLLVGAGMKIVYDVLLYTAFRRHRPPEERAGSDVRSTGSRSEGRRG
jgi:MFS family permease